MDLSDHDIGDEDVLHVGEKKRRLTLEQVKTLETSFDVGNKLEFERKMLLAKALGLQPKQISVWFQNRRAKCKAKQVEKEFAALKQEYDTLKSKYEILLAENKRFKAEMKRLSREPENIDGNNKVSGSEIKPQHKSENSVIEPTNTSPTIRKGQEGGCYSIMSEPGSSVFNQDRPRTIQSPQSPCDPLTAGAGYYSSPLPLEGSSVAGHALKTPPPSGNEMQCLPKVEVDSAWLSQAEKTSCTLFHSLDDQGALMLWEYWHLPDE